MKKFLSIILSISMIFSLAACGKTSDSKAEDEGAKKEKKTITIGTSGQYYPWAHMKEGKLEGFEISVWEEIAKRNNLEIKYETSKFSGLVGMLDAKKIDSIAHQMSITPEREEKYLFTEPYAYSYYDFMVLKDSPIKTLEDLKGKKVGCWLGGNGEKTLREMDQKFNLGLEIVTYDGTPIEKEVENQRIDAGWQGEIKTLATIEQSKLPLRLLGDKHVFEVNAYPFAKDFEDKQLIEDISKTIKNMREDGTLKKLSEKWFGINTVDKPAEKK
ncbi:putative amino-acid transport system substrate-binding protein [Clostridium collagenovorans DSM 3089]|uniref:Putative amino-acid transport system substrate-binding protein n=1 Tax=Clostridium collagenovorans DSM 3089 TaxID=1121306 RepID=A0A1M5U1N5_9CLOT|nr:transporter substrate-binding domain-containing protein [Clostridium collagenovorans]SHH57005.1 putative amino-acid transport system substrate-binding protein [Clostridium collagenovorans DSM 3089]